MRRGSLIFTGALLLISILLVIATLAYPFKAEVFPLIVLVLVLTLLTIQVFREVSALKEKGVTEEKKRGNSAQKHVTIWIWIVGTNLMLWVLGFMGTVIFLPFLYLRSKKVSWLGSIAFSLGCGVFFYGLFDLGLNMPLYPGLILPLIFG